MQVITFIIPNHNTLPYLKLAYQSIRDNSVLKHKIIILDDASTDGSVSWLKEIKLLDDDLKVYSFDKKYGHTILYNIGVNKCETDIFCFFHSDMYMAKGFDIAILNYLQRKSIVSGTRIEPPLHPVGKEKIIKDFGLFYNTFDISKFNSFAQEESNKNEFKTTRGIFAPWAAYKEDFQEIGGHDILFAPYPLEDSDIFQRFILNKFKILQARDALVYHFTCRGHKLTNDNDLNKVDSNYEYYNKRAQRNFVRKWGMLPANDEYLYPIIYKKEDIGLVYEYEYDKDILIELEPFANNIYSNELVRDMYCDAMRGDTTIPLDKKFSKVTFDNDIKLSLKRKKIEDDDLSLLYYFQRILNTTSLNSRYESENLIIDIINLELPNSKYPKIKI